MVSGLRLHYNVFGEGTPILFIHGWGGSSKSLNALAHLASSSFSAYVLDLPGFGKSSLPPSSWGVEDYAQCVIECMNLLHIKPHYFGHSFGGELGIYIGAKHHTHILSLTLCNSAYKREHRVTTTARYAKLFRLLPFGLYDMLYPTVKQMYYRIFHRNSDLLAFPQLEQNFRKIVTYDISALVRDVSVATCIIWGEDDSITPVLWAYELHSRIKKSALVVVPKTRHDLPIKHPDLVWKELQSFISL